MQNKSDLSKPFLDEGFLHACRHGNLREAEDFRAQGADIRYLNDYPLRVASEKGHFSIVQFLLQNGADVHAQDDFAFRYAFKNRHLEVAKFLIDNGANIHAYNDYVLSLGFAGGCLDSIKLLVENGADIHFNNDYPLQHACVFGRLHIIKYLVEKGADVHWNNEFALRIASKCGYLDMVKYLVGKGANVRGVELTRVSQFNQFEIILFLVQNGADDSTLSPLIKTRVRNAIEMEEKRRVWAVNTIGSWWIPICYDVNRECGKRMMERSWKRVEEMYKNN